MTWVCPAGIAKGTRHGFGDQLHRAVHGLAGVTHRDDDNLLAGGSHLIQFTDTDAGDQFPDRTGIRRARGDARAHPGGQQIGEHPPSARRPEHPRVPAEHQPAAVRQGLHERRGRLDVQLRGVQHDQQIEGESAVLVPAGTLGAGQESGDGDRAGRQPVAAVHAVRGDHRAQPESPGGRSHGDRLFAGRLAARVQNQSMPGDRTEQFAGGRPGQRRDRVLPGVVGAGLHEPGQTVGEALLGQGITVEAQQDRHRRPGRLLVRHPVRVFQVPVGVAERPGVGALRTRSSSRPSWKTSTAPSATACSSATSGSGTACSVSAPRTVADGSAVCPCSAARSSSQPTSATARRPSPGPACGPSSSRANPSACSGRTPGTESNSHGSSRSASAARSPSTAQT